jgi:hypothetical protein
MQQKEDNQKTVIDYITGKEIPDIGAEANRQAVERFLVEEKGFLREDIEVSLPISFDIDGENYQSRVDLVVSVGDKRLMAIKCAAGSLGSREREILAAARITDTYQLPFAMVSDGKTAILLDTLSGKKLGEGLEEIPSRQKLSTYAKNAAFLPFSKERLRPEKLIFRTYDRMNVNRR